MKTKKQLKIFFTGITMTISFVMLFHGCLHEDYPENYVTSTEEQIGEFLENNPDQFSEFCRILDTTAVMGLLKAYGQYTCFIPTNDAIKEYIESEGNTQLSDFSLSELKTLCFNHIIKGDTIRSVDFAEGALGSLSMSERFLSVSYSPNSPTIYINGKSPILEKDIFRHNGIIHIIGRVIASSKVMLADKLSEDSLFTIYSKALKITGIAEIINTTPAEDESFDPDYHQWTPSTHTVPEEYPKSRKIGFTIIAPSDESLSKYTECPAVPEGVKSLSDLEKVAVYYYSKVFPEDASVKDYTDKRNYLNRFISYHCFKRTLLSNRFIKDFDTPHMHKTYDMFEYIETMLENTLLEVRLDRDYIVPNSELGLINSMGNPTNAILFTNYNNKPDGGALNGYYHEITKPVIYSKEFVADISTKRLRLDGASFFPEFATNNMRGSNPTAVSGVIGKTHNYLMPRKYLDRFECSENTRFTYLGASEAYENFQGDELFLTGTYNFTLTTSPIPAGTYEIRMGYQATSNRGIAQLYWDSVPCGIPLNLSLLATDPEIGYTTPGSSADDPYGYENDKMMHNRGYMKGPSSYFCYGYWWYGYNSATARLGSRVVRRVLGTFTLTEATTHKFTVISLGSTSSSTQFMLDYLEFCPTELLETEGID